MTDDNLPCAVWMIPFDQLTENSTVRGSLPLAESHLALYSPGSGHRTGPDNNCEDWDRNRSKLLYDLFLEGLVLKDLENSPFKQIFFIKEKGLIYSP